MKINKEFLIEKSVSTDVTRRTLHTMELVQEGKQAFLVATDGKQLAKVPVTLEDGDTLGKVSVEALKAARKARSKSSSDAIMMVNGKQEIPNGPSFPRPTIESHGIFPEYKQVFPTEKGTIKIGLDPKRLLALAQALGTENIILEIIDQNRAIVVTGDKYGAIGVLMPSCLPIASNGQNHIC